MADTLSRKGQDNTVSVNLPPQEVYQKLVQPKLGIINHASHDHGSRNDSRTRDLRSTNNKYEDQGDQGACQPKKASGWTEDGHEIVGSRTYSVHLNMTYSGARLAKLYMSRTVCLHGVPKRIVSDQGA